MDPKRQGIQIWTVPKTGYYKFDVSGAGGNDNLGDFTSGASSTLTGYVKLKMNEKIHIACGQNGNHFNHYSYHIGGHGGTFVVNEYNIPLIITGGATGFKWARGIHNAHQWTHGRSILTNFVNGVAPSTRYASQSAYKSDGMGGDTKKGNYEHGSAGAGFYGDAPYHENITTPAKGWENGLTGGKVAGYRNSYAAGGFGGGGANFSDSWSPHYSGLGGGGGYSGGEGSKKDRPYPAGAGGSYYDTTRVRGFKVGSEYSGPGKVIVTFDPDVKYGYKIPVLKVTGTMRDSSNEPVDKNSVVNYNPSWKLIYKDLTSRKFFVITYENDTYKKLGFSSYEDYKASASAEAWWIVPHKFTYRQYNITDGRTWTKQITIYKGKNAKPGTLLVCADASTSPSGIHRDDTFTPIPVKNIYPKNDIKHFMFKQNRQSSTEIRGEVGYVTISGTGNFSDYMIYGRPSGPYYLGSTIIKPDTGYHKVVWPEKYKIGDQQVWKITYNSSTNDYIISPTCTGCIYNIGSMHSDYTNGPGNPSNPTLKITKTSSGNWTLYEKTKKGYIICRLIYLGCPSCRPPNGMGYPQIDPSATTSTAGVQYKLTFI